MFIEQMAILLSSREVLLVFGYYFGAISFDISFDVFD
jgi:hypothetical protein